MHCQSRKGTSPRSGLMVLAPRARIWAVLRSLASSLDDGDHADPNEKAVEARTFFSIAIILWCGEELGGVLCLLRMLFLGH